MGEFTESFICKTRAACKQCRTNAEWRKTANAPEECPFGIVYPPTGEPSLPSVARMAGNLASSVVKDVAQGMPRRSEEEAQRILREICATCEFYRASDYRCSKCGCFLVTKTTWKSQHCPVGKW